MMAALTITLLLALLVGSESNRLIDVQPIRSSCEKIDYTVASVCKPLQTNYNSTAFPNLHNDETQQQAVKILEAFGDLIDSDCSKFARDFLCSYFIPPCFTLPNNDVAMKLHSPCRNLCEDVYNNCIDLISDAGKSWPDYLNCSLFPVSNGACYGQTPTFDIPKEPDFFEGNTATSVCTCIYLIISALVTALYFLQNSI